MENLDSAWDEEEEGSCLPIPPLDDGAFSPYHPTAFSFFQFFDEIDDNGNVRDNWGSTCHGGREKQRTQCRGKEMTRLIEVLLKPEEPSSEPEPEGHSKPFSRAPMADNQKKNNQACPDSTPAGGDEKGSFDRKAGDEKKEINHQRKRDNSNPNSMAAVESKFESTKRKLQESYHNIENAKKQRRIQVIDFQPIPTQVACHKVRRPTSKKCNSRLPAPKKFNSRLLIGQH